MTTILLGCRQIKIKRVFIFAHCDDELFCLPLLLEKNSENTLIFLTTQSKDDVKSSEVNIRSKEALRANSVLSEIANTKTVFYGEGIYDGTIHADFSADNFRNLTRIVLKEKPDELVTLSYEAGHQDHDSTHLITRLISENEGIRFRCFSGYRALKLVPRLFSVLKPAAPLERIAFNRPLITLSAIRLMMIYKSQSKTWIGLAPGLLFKYAFFTYWESKCEESLPFQRLRNTFYETRGRAKQSDVLKSHQRFAADFIIER